MVNLKHNGRRPTILYNEKSSCEEGQEKRRDKMKRITMKGKTVDDAVEAALAVLGGKKEDAKIMIKVLKISNSILRLSYIGMIFTI